MCINYAEIALFLIAVISTLLLGTKISNILDLRKSSLNRTVLLGETFLLGSIGLIGIFLLLSLISLYRWPALLGATLLNFLWLLDASVRKHLKECFVPLRLGVGEILFLLALLVLVFRNCFFLVDVDSFSVYLFTQKLWILHGSSLIGSPNESFGVFLPQFDYVLDGLGLSLFPHETFFPALINLFWRVITLALLFGYTKHTLKNSFLALSAVLLTLLNDHFFYSGINHSVLINSALLVLLFGSAYNFWEAKSKNDTSRFVLACIFASQLLANKYQMTYVAIFLPCLGFLIQDHKKALIGNLIKNKSLVFALITAIGIMSFWWIKNFLVTGDPIFPGMAGKFHAFGWTIQEEHAIIQVLGGISPGTFFKYISFLFIWPGIKAAKIVLLIILALPFMLIFFESHRQKNTHVKINELGYWVALSILVLFGICLMSHQDSRYYRFPLPIFSLTAVYGCYYLLTQLLRLDPRLSTAFILILSVVSMSNEGIRVPLLQGGSQQYPTIKDNINVLTGKIKTSDAINPRYPEIQKILEFIKENPDKFQHAAWNLYSFNTNIPGFFIPPRPIVGLWYSNLIRWDSYGNKERILNDFKSAHVEWVIELKNGAWQFTPVDAFASGISAEERFPPHKLFAYSGIADLDDTHF